MSDDRRERLAAQLRENLRRRKAQARSRRADAAETGHESAANEPEEDSGLDVSKDEADD